MLTKFQAGSLFLPLTVCVFAAIARAQSTVPHWSSYFGGSGDHDMAMVVKRGPGSLLTVVGHTGSNGLATPGSYRPAITGPVGNVDVFVARFDTSLPPAQQKQWCTYFGGDEMELVFDAEVDAAGVVTLVGLTLSDSSSFPVVNGFQVARKGPSDGFVARIDPNLPSAQQLVYSSYIGSSGDDRVCALQVDGSGNLTIAGVAEGTGLVGTAGTIGPAYQGGSDSFVARIEPTLQPAAQLRWATYLGGPFNDGLPFSNWAGWNAQWEGQLRTCDLAVEQSGSVVVGISCQSAGLPTTPGCLQPTHGGGNGLGNIYLARLAPGATSIQYATYFGGAGNGVRDMVVHPGGGFVLVGQCIATNIPTTPNCYQPAYLGGPHGGLAEGYVCWIDPSRPANQQLLYASYIGGNGGEDGLVCAEVESSGIVTVAGYLSGGFTMRSTPGSMQPTSNPYEFTGYLARLAMNGNGTSDLLYATYLGDSWTLMQSVALDDVGDAIVVGTSFGAAYATTPNAYQPAHSGGGRDAVMTHVPLMSGGTSRFDLAFATPACPLPLHHGTFGTPISSNPSFALSATNAPPTSFGLLAFGLTSLPGPVWVPQLGVNALVLPTVFSGTVTSDALGFATCPVPIPAGLPPGFAFESQWLFLTNLACPGTGPFAASEGLLLTTL